MGEEQAQIILTELRGFRELVEEKFDNNEAAHKVVTDHLAKLNGQTAKNSCFVIEQKITNKWVYGICTLIIIPVVFLIIKEIL